MKDIPEGILQDGQNFKDDDTVIEVGGEGPTEDEVKYFTLELSEEVRKEIAGFVYSSDGSGNVTDIVLGGYVDNSYTTSTVGSTEIINKYGFDNFSADGILQRFHTHPDGKLGATQSNPQISGDFDRLMGQKPLLPRAEFIILYSSPKYYVDLLKKDYVIIRYPFIPSSFFGTQT